MTNRINSLRRDMLELFITAYGQDYGCQKGSLTQFHNEAFAMDVAAVMNYRKGIQATSSGSAAAPPAQAEGSESYCAIA